MKINCLLWCLYISPILLFSSCQEDSDETWNEDYIIAGDKNQPGLQYHNINPDVSMYFFDAAWEEVVYSLDLDSQGSSDLMFVKFFDYSKRDKYDDTLSVVVDAVDTGTKYYILTDPDGNALIVNPGDTIRAFENFRATEVTLFKRYYPCEPAVGCEEKIEGYWMNTNNKYIALRDENGKMGWIKIGVDDSENMFKVYEYGIMK